MFLPLHWGFTQEKACEANTLMHDDACPVSKQPELKACAVIVAPAVSVVKPVEQETRTPGGTAAPAHPSTSLKAASRLWWS